MRKIYFSLLIIWICSLSTFSQDLTGVKICVNPGHGGYEASNDRNVVIYPFKTGDENGFWESQSNLDKGLYLEKLLLASNADVVMTRRTNTTADDLDLSVIVEMANANNCDLLLSIHSNAGVNNYILMLCSGKDPTDTHVYPETISLENQRISREIGTLIGDNLYTNEVSCWFSRPTIRGDKTFAREAMKWSNGYGVLRWLTVPGVLSEGAMHDYIPETYRLMNMQYKQMEAWHFFKTFCQYFGRGEQSIGKVAGWVKDKWDNFNDAFPVPQKYHYQRGTADEFMPLNRTRVSVLSDVGNKELKSYTTDEMYNGFFLIDSLEPGSYKLKFEREQYTTLIKDITIEANKINYANAYLEKDRTQPLKVKAYYPDVSVETPVSAGTHVRFDFNFEIDSESFEKGFHISPQVDGTFKYEQYQRSAIFVPNKALDINTEYTIVLDKEVKHIGNIEMEESVSFKFLTKSVNEFVVLDHYPKNGEKNVFPNTLVVFYFNDKLMTQPELYESFTLLNDKGIEETQNGIEVNAYPGDLGQFTFKGYLRANTTYTVKMDKGISSIDSLFIGDDMQFSFTTGSEAVQTFGQVEDFEDRNLFVIDDSNTFNINPEVTVMMRYSSMSLTGSRSYQLFYEFTADEGSIATNYIGPSITVQNLDTIGINIYGDLSYNELSLVVTNGTEDYIFPIGSMDYAGWKFHAIEIIGLNLGKENKLKGFVLNSTKTPYSWGGRILFDNMLLYNAELNNVGNIIRQDRLFTIYPNPASNKIYFIKPFSNNKSSIIRIYSSEGVLQKECLIEASCDFVNVDFLNVGTYIIVLENENSVYTSMFVKK